MFQWFLNTPLNITTIRHMKIKKPEVSFIIKTFLIENDIFYQKLHSFSLKNIFYDKMDLRLFYFRVTNYS